MENTQTFNLYFFNEEIKSKLDIKKVVTYEKNREVLHNYINDTAAKKVLTLKDKEIDEDTVKEILRQYQTISFIDLNKEELAEDILLNMVKDGLIVDVKNGHSIYTFELGQENIFCTINCDDEHSYFMKSSYEDFGRMKGELEYKDFKELLDKVLTKAPSQIDLLQEKISHTLNNLADKLDSPETKAKIEHFFRQMAVFHNFSFNNQMLLAIEADNRDEILERVASFNVWKKLGGVISKGEKGYSIIAPNEGKVYLRQDGNFILDNEGNKLPKIDSNGKPETYIHFSKGFVFDINQLSNSQEIHQKLELGYRDNNEQISAEELSDFINNISLRYKLNIEFKKINGTTKGYYNIGTNNITISSELTNNETLACAYHELGHYLFHKDISYEEIHDNRGYLEGEAESFSKILTQMHGFNQASELYLSTWKNTGDDLRNNLEKISKTAKEAIQILGLDKLQKSLTDIVYEQKQDKKRESINMVAELAKSKTVNTNSYAHSSAVAR